MLLKRSIMVGILAPGLIPIAIAGAPRFPIDLDPESVRSTGRPEPSLRQGSWEATARDQLAQGCDPSADRQHGRNPYADTIIGRQRLALDRSADEARAAMAATLSQDPRVAFANTALLRDSISPDLRYLGWLIPAMVHLRAKGVHDSDALEALLDGLALVAEDARISTADLDLLRAMVALAHGNRDQAANRLATALSKEADYYNARLLRLRLRLVALNQPPAWGCVDAFDDLFEDLTALVGLTRCPLQAAQSELFLRRSLARPRHHPGFLAVRVYLGLMARRYDHAEQALEGFDQLQGVVCRGILSARLHRLLSLGQDRTGAD